MFTHLEHLKRPPMTIKAPFPPRFPSADFKELLKLLLYSVGDNISQLAEDLDVTRPTIHRWIRDTRPPDRWWYRLVFEHSLRLYHSYHASIVNGTITTSNSKRQKSQHILTRINAYLATHTSAADLTDIDTPTDRFDFEVTSIPLDGEADPPLQDCTYIEAARYARTDSDSGQFKRIQIIHTPTSRTVYTWRRPAKFAPPPPEEVLQSITQDHTDDEDD